MFEKGDIVHISHKWLDEGEDPNGSHFAHTIVEFDLAAYEALSN